ncbi:MAG: excinuclease ABC subunit UvrA [Chloroflexi bacterium]|nr:excinuclease ABC subunit UvrA [Chloroflexota bacterium]OJV89641.1 MAG: excinuclease ABC subunit A [Chloroflexi bacterium 54-19]
MHDKIIVRGAKEHNLKDIDIEMPRDKLVVITGLSGSGKSSLAFDTIYAEGQRRYVESLSAYARQFLGLMEKPDVDYIEGLSPAISIDQKGTSTNPRSTVGTITEIYDYLRLLFARIGHPHCPNCGREISRQTVQQIVDTVADLPEGSRLLILGPVINDRKGEHKGVFEDLRKKGFVRVRVNGQVRDLDEEFELEKYKKHTIEAVVDRIIIRREPDGTYSEKTRLTDSIETALKLGSGIVTVVVVDGEELRFSENYACVYDGISIGEIEPRTFSFNTPHGACPECSGLGEVLDFEPDLVIPNRSLTLAEGAVLPWNRLGQYSSTYMSALLSAVGSRYGFDLATPLKEFNPEQLGVLLYGLNGDVVTVKLRGNTTTEATFEGIIPDLKKRYKESSSDYMKSEIEKFMIGKTCPVCNGSRLKKEAISVTIANKSIVDVVRSSVSDALLFFNSLWVNDQEETGAGKLNEREVMIARQVLKEIRSRLGFLMDVGLDYLTIDRSAATLAGGEAQRIRLATQIGSSLMGVLYILDEPSIGLHQRDNGRLINTLLKLRNLGNTLIVVEHDEEMIRSADYLIDMGPGAGIHGGEVIASGTPEEVAENPNSITGQYLKGTKEISIPARRRKGNGKQLLLKGARENNLKNVDLAVPLGRFIAVTGVSGSGKSTLITDTLYRKLAHVLYGSKEKAGEHDTLLGIENIDKIIEIDQAPIGRTPRSNPATYTGVFTQIREIFSKVPESRTRGYEPGRFSFNVKGGRCEACQGDGIIKIEMQFLPDVYVPCEVCHGKRYNREALEILYKGKNISDVLDMTVEVASEFFANVPAIKNKLDTLVDVGLGYIRMGQPATTLSGGEAQRVKLATELSKRATGRTLYMLDEPSTGLHTHDVSKLIDIMQRLVDTGNTVLVIEHNLDIIKVADWIVDIGPEGGNKGGMIVAEGTPEEIAEVKGSYTGHYLKQIFEKEALKPKKSELEPVRKAKKEKSLAAAS